MEILGFCLLLIRLFLAFLFDAAASWMRQHRLTCITVLAAALMYWLYCTAPHMVMERVHYKAVLQMVGAAIGYAFDYGVFPYARPHGYLVKDWRKCMHSFCEAGPDHPVHLGYRMLFVVACLRRVAFMGAGVYGMTQGL